MNARIALAVVAIAMTPPVLANDNPVEELARQSGLSERRVQMLLGNRTSFAEYRYTYDRSLERLLATVGDENYRRLIAGESIVLPQRLADVDPGAAGRDSETAIETTL